MIKACKSCPIAQETEEGVLASDAGCLPCPADAMKWFDATGRMWACHARPDQPCAGFLQLLLQAGKTVDMSLPLITEKTPFGKNGLPCDTKEAVNMIAFSKWWFRSGFVYIPKEDHWRKFPSERIYTDDDMYLLFTSQQLL